MIRMTRLHLINWHNFHDNIISFKDITYLLGVNAVGKTTIMDAIRYCLTTNKDFNTAGNKKSGRTLLGSVHQKQRAEESYLRPGHTVSYVGIEFLDENIKKTFVISVRVESEAPKQDLKGVYQDWYITKPGYMLEDVPYFTETKEGRRPTSREAFKISNKGMDRASNQQDARRRICRVLGIGDSQSPIGKKFNEVFHMGTSLEDIKDIREFIYTYILPEPEVNIEFLQKDMRELERLQEILQEASDRQVLLAEINEKIIEAKERLSKVKINEMLVAYADFQGNIEEQEEKKDQIDKWLVTIGILKDELLELSEKENKANNLLYAAKREAEDNAENKAMLSLEQDNKENIAQREKYLHEAAEFEESANRLSSLKKSLNKSGFEISFKDIASGALINDIKAASDSLKALEEPVKNQDAKIRTEIFNLSKEMRELELKIKSLESGVMYYPKEASLVKDMINEELRNQSKKEDAKLLCELLYMTDESWQDAVESYLNTQRFNVIVSPENYPAAKKVFISLGDKVKGIGLIDTRKINDIEYGENDYSYLGDKIDSENIYAKRYARYVMKNVICCENSDDLELYSKSVTRDRLRFQNFCLQRMGKKEHFIGIDAIAKQLSLARTNLRSLQKSKAEMEDTKKAFDLVYKSYNSFMAGEWFNRLERYSNSGKKAEELGIKIVEIKAQIEEFKKNPILLAVYDRVAECEKTLSSLRKELTGTEAKKQNLESALEDAKVRIKRLEELNVPLKNVYDDLLKQYPEFAGDVEKKYDSERKTKSASVIVNNFRNRANSDNTSLFNYISQNLLPLQQKYTATYTCDFPDGIEGASRYQQEYYSLQNIELEHHRAELLSAQMRCKERFRKEVLFRMKDDILRAKQQFKQINRVMENLEYGEENYRFSIDKSSDRELGLFYDIIMDKENRQINQEEGLIALIQEADKSEIFESQIDDFMSRIMIDVEEHAKENLTGRKSDAKSMGMYVDYRTYLDYDIVVRNSVTLKEVALSKVSGEGSGGENQAPFYVAICASLLQIYEQNPDGCMRLVLLDEAFNNMTSDRIEPMMNMFKKLNLQLVLIATAEKATAILPYCDITYSIVKSGNRNAIGVFENI